MHKLYAVANAIYSYVKFASEIAVLFLNEIFLIYYLSEVLNYSRQQLT